MMKKKLFSLAVTLVMALSLAVPAMAAEITVNEAADGQTYNAYKIFDVSRSGEAYAYSIDSNSKWFDAVQEFATEANGLDLNQIGSTTTYNVAVDTEVFTAAKAGDFAKALNDAFQAMDPKPAADGTATAADGTATIEVAEAGYYFVDSSLGALCILNTAADSVTVVEKNDEPTIGKEVVGEDKNTASIGDTVEYKITVTAGGAADTTYVVHDTMSDGLTLNTGSFQITVNEAAVEEEKYTINTTPEDNCTFEITFNQDYTASLAAGTKIVITYSAVLNENAQIGTNPETNGAILGYGNSSTTKTETETYTYGFDLVKTDGNNKVLTGAKFKLYDAETGGNEIKVVKVDGQENTYRVAKTDEVEQAVEIEAGNVKIIGLANGTYYLEETDAPEGYNMLEERVAVTVENGNNYATVEDDVYSVGGVHVVNQAGGILPGTGGMGTTIFYVVGGTLVVAAAVLLITKKRMHNVED